MRFAIADATQLAAAIAYYSLLAIVPLVLLVAAVVGLVIRDPDAQTRLLDLLARELPIESSSIENSLGALADLGPVLAPLALGGSLFSVHALASTVRRSFRVILGSEGRRPFVWGLVVDYTIVPLLGLLLIASFAATAAWRLARESGPLTRVFDTLPLALAGELLALLIPGAVTVAAFLAIYVLLPNRRIATRDAWPGALVAGFAFEALKVGFSIYVANARAYDIVYGSLGGSVLLLLWVYLSANILLFGAAFVAETPRVTRESTAGAATSLSAISWRAAFADIARGLVLAPGPREDARDALREGVAEETGDAPPQC